MVEATSDSGESIRALNEVYVGQPGHQSARYELRLGAAAEAQSSSGLLVGTGTGGTGWLRSAWLERHSELALPDRDAPVLACFGDTIEADALSISWGQRLTVGVSDVTLRLVL